MGIKILIVDDMLPARAFIRGSIKAYISKDIETDEANSGEAAKAKLGSHNYDLVLCDWNMPGMKGSELLEWIKSQDNLKHIPFIMVTAHNEKEIIMDAIKLGVKDFLIKPITADDLSKKVRAVLAEVLARKKKETEGGQQVPA